MRLVSISSPAMIHFGRAFFSPEPGHIANSSPRAPFMTSTLQQEGGRKLGMSAQQVMRVAQGLYERGYITYMRTDSTNLSETAVKAARKWGYKVKGIPEGQA